MARRKCQQRRGLAVFRQFMVRPFGEFRKGNSLRTVNRADREQMSDCCARFGAMRPHGRQCNPIRLYCRGSGSGLCSDCSLAGSSVTPRPGPDGTRK